MCTKAKYRHLHLHKQILKQCWPCLKIIKKRSQACQSITRRFKRWDLNFSCENTVDHSIAFCSQVHYYSTHTNHQKLLRGEPIFDHYSRNCPYKFSMSLSFPQESLTVEKSTLKLHLFTGALHASNKGKHPRAGLHASLTCKSMQCQPILGTSGAYNISTRSIVVQEALELAEASVIFYQQSLLPNNLPTIYSNSIDKMLFFSNFLTSPWNSTETLNTGQKIKYLYIKSRCQVWRPYYPKSAKDRLKMESSPPVSNKDLQIDQ